MAFPICTGSMADAVEIAALRVTPRPETLASLKLTSEQKEELTHPPRDADGGLITVNYRLTVFHLGCVDTREQTASIRMGVVLYWTDPRMIGWTSPILPPTLWGPELFLKNAIGGADLEYEQFVVTDKKEGRMKRIINYEATIMVPMELRTFPFDMQSIAPEWVSISHWRQLDQNRYGSLPHGQSYRLAPVDRAGEGNPLLMFFAGDIPEWRLEACSTRLTTALNPAGFTITALTVQFSISRRYAYYITKVIAPLVILTLANSLVHFIEPHLLADRIANIFTMFLAAYALLYVVGEHVPHVAFLTTIDRFIFVNLGCLLFAGVTSVVVWCASRAPLAPRDSLVWHASSGMLRLSPPYSSSRLVISPHHLIFAYVCRRAGLSPCTLTASARASPGALRDAEERAARRGTARASRGTTRTRAARR